MVAREIVVTTDVMEPEFLAEMTETVEVTVATGSNGYGEASYDPATARAIEAPARVVRKASMRRNRDGQMVQSSFRVIVAMVGLAPDDKITLPSLDLVPVRPVVTIEEYRTEGGIRHHSTIFYS